MKKHKKYILFGGLITLLLIGYWVADAILFTGIKPRMIQENGFQANYFVKNTIKSKAAVILVGGGQWGDYWAQQFAQKEMVGVSLPYTRKEGLPKLPEEIELGYFENAINWLREQPEVDPNKIVVMGASRNAELALVIASIFPKTISGVVAYAPSAVSWSNTVLPYNSDVVKPSWRYKGAAIPYIPMAKISGNESNTINMLGYWNDGLAKTDFAERAAIKVGKINGPILLFSGNDDMVWPSSLMADMLEKRAIEAGFEHSFQNIKYDNAGHLISTNPDAASGARNGTMILKGKEYTYEFGGNEDGDFKAKQDARVRLMKFLEEL